MDHFYEIKQKLLSHAASDENLMAVIVLGSSARQQVKADAYSDLDLILVCSDPDSWLHGDYPNKLGEIQISFLEKTIGGAQERRILYDQARDVDLIAISRQMMENLITSGAASGILGRGYDVLHDRIGIKELLAAHIRTDSTHKNVSQEVFDNIVQDFWFHTVWAAKKILRGEIWVAKMCVDAYLKSLLLKIIELSRSAETDTWHNGRFLEKWAGQETVNALGGCFAHYEKADIVSALQNTAQLFGALAPKAAQIHGFDYPQKAQCYALSLLAKYFD